MTNFELWTRGCEINGATICRLEETNEAKLYKVFKKHECSNYYFNDVVTYHVWLGDKEVLTTANMIEAYNKYNMIAPASKR